MPAASLRPCGAPIPRASRLAAATDAACRNRRNGAHNLSDRRPLCGCRFRCPTQILNGGKRWNRKGTGSCRPVFCRRMGGNGRKRRRQKAKQPRLTPARTLRPAGSSGRDRPQKEHRQSARLERPHRQRVGAPSLSLLSSRWIGRRWHHAANTLSAGRTRRLACKVYRSRI